MSARVGAAASWVRRKATRLPHSAPHFLAKERSVEHCLASLLLRNQTSKLNKTLHTSIVHSLGKQVLVYLLSA